MKQKIQKSEEEWKKTLTPIQFKILRKKGTESPFTGKHLYNTKNGVYCCAGCGQKLFSSDTKYNSGSGWPSFWAPLSGDRIKIEKDTRQDMQRTEVLCSKCGGHLGHVFNDGPQPTGKRYCTNSAVLDFHEEQEPKDV